MELEHHTREEVLNRKKKRLFMYVNEDGSRPG